jgi:hypothetical protein
MTTAALTLHGHRANGRGAVFPGDFRHSVDAAAAAILQTRAGPGPARMRGSPRRTTRT